MVFLTSSVAHHISLAFASTTGHKVLETIVSTQRYPNVQVFSLLSSQKLLKDHQPYFTSQYSAPLKSTTRS